MCAHAHPSEGRDGEFSEAEHDRRNQNDGAQPCKDDQPDVPSDKRFWTRRQTDVPKLVRDPDGAHFNGKEEAGDSNPKGDRDPLEDVGASEVEHDA